MILFDILYNITIYPIEFIIEIVFYYFKVICQGSYTISVFITSIIINILALPLYNKAEEWQNKERNIQNKMKPMIDNIKAVYKGDQRYLLIRTCQRINGYKTIYAFRGTLGLLIQIPFFLAGYNFFNSLTGAYGESFLLIKSLGEADKLIHIGNFTINLLPFIMTFFSLLSTIVYSKKLTFKESIPIFLMSLFFLVFLYNSPAILLLYWTINCAFSFFKNLVLFNLDKVKLMFKNKKIILILKIIYILYSVLIAIMTILFFARNYFIHKSSEYKILKAFILHIKTYKDLLFIWIILLIIILGFILYKKKILNSIEIKNKFKLFISSISTITILLGLFVLTSLIASSGQEFEKPFEIIWTNFFKYVGLFFIYPLFLYFLFNDKFKNIITLISIIFALLFLSNTFIMVIDYGFIASNFKFELEYLLVPTINQIILNLILMFIILFIALFIIKKNFQIYLFNIFIIIIISLISISVFDFIKINKEQKILSEITSANSINKENKNYDIFNFSKTGTNIFIIILDRGCPEFAELVFNNFPNIKSEMDGFVYYYNTVSMAGGTFGSIQTLYGGYEYMPLEINEKFDLKEKYNESLIMMPKLFSDIGYKTITFAPAFANFSWTSDLTIFKEYTNIKAYNIEKSMIEKELNNLLNNSDNISEREIFEYNKHRSSRFALFRALPVFLRYQLYSHNDWFIPNGNRNLAIVGKGIEEYALLQALTNLTKINNIGNCFNIIHSDTTHEPFNYNNDFKPSLEIRDVPKEDLEFYGSDFSARSYYSTVASFRELANLFKFLKENNIYDNTKIIITSDHSGYFNPSIFNEKGMEEFKVFNAMMFVKDLNSRGEIISNGAFTTIADIPFLATKHLNKAKNPFTKKIITNDYKTNGVDIIISKHSDPKGHFKTRIDFDYYYHVKDNIFDINNWKKFEINWKTKESKEIKLK